MFTGLTEEIGRIKSLKKMSHGIGLRISARMVSADVREGDSVSVDGVCLTASGTEPGVIYFDVVSETLGKTTLGTARVNDQVNLERALRMDSRLGGHFVYGHVDGIGRIMRIAPGEMIVRFPAGLKAFIRKGSSAAVDGISLTVQKACSPDAVFAVIPHTYRNTSLKTKKPGSAVNIEVDFILKQVITLTMERQGL